MGDTIPTFPNIADKRAALVAYVMDRYQDAERGDRPFKDRALLNWKAYCSVLPSHIRGFSSIYDPQTYVATSGTVEQWTGPLFSKDKVFDLEPLGGQDDIQTELMREMMAFLLREKIKYKLIKHGQATEATLFGNAVEQHDWTEYVTRGPKLAYGGYGPDERETWPRSTIKSRFDVYPARTGATIQEMPYFITRSLVTLEYLKSLGPALGLDAETLEKLDAEAFLVGSQEGTINGASGENMIDLWELLAAVGYDVKGGREAGAAGENAVKYVEILTYTERPAQRDGGAWMAMMANRQYPLKAMLNPFEHGLKPYSEIKFAPMLPNVWRAWGLPEIVEPVQMRINQLQNQFSDATDLAVRPPRMVSNTAGIKDLENLSDWPGKAIRVNDITGIKLQERPALSFELMRTIDHLYGQFQRLSQNGDASRGLTGSVAGQDRGAETLGGLQLILQQQSRNTMFRLALAEETGVAEGLQITAQNLGQVMTETKVLQVTNNEILARRGYGKAVTITPEMIRGPWKFYAVGASKAHEDTQTAGLLADIVERSAKDPEVRSNMKMLEIIKAVWEMAGIKQTNRFFKTEEEKQADAMQALRAQMMAQGAGGMAGGPMQPRREMAMAG